MRGNLDIQRDTRDVCSQRKDGDICKPRKEASEETKLADTLLGLLAIRYVRIKFLLHKPASFWYLVMKVQETNMLYSQRIAGGGQHRENELENKHISEKINYTIFWSVHYKSKNNSLIG